MSSNNKSNSLLGGRNVKPLTQDEITRAANTFIGLEPSINARYEGNQKTSFRVKPSSVGENYGEIVFSEDLYPGSNITNPNSALSLKGAVAHELTHYHRWQDKTELDHGQMTHLDEAITSLEATLRYYSHLNPTDIQGLISDSLSRLRLFINEENQG